MKQTSFFITTVILSSVAAMAGDQSLADMARKEAERRKGLERIEEKVIEGGSPTQLAPGGNLTTSSSPSKGSRRQVLAGEARASRAQSGTGFESWIARLQKLTSGSQLYALASRESAGPRLRRGEGRKRKIHPNGYARSFKNWS